MKLPKLDPFRYCDRFKVCGNKAQLGSRYCPECQKRENAVNDSYRKLTTKSPRKGQRKTNE